MSRGGGNSGSRSNPCNGELHPKNVMAFALSMRRRRRRPLDHRLRAQDDPCEHQHHLSIMKSNSRAYRLSSKCTNNNRNYSCRRIRHAHLVFNLKTFLLLTLWSTTSTFAKPNFIRPRASFVSAPSFLTRTNGSNSANDRASLFVSIQQPKSTAGSRGGTAGRDIMSSFSYKSDRNKGHNNQNHDDSQPLTFQPENLLQKLNSFSSNISRLRMVKKKQSLAPTTKSGGTKTKTFTPKQRKHNAKVNDDALIGACTSLVYFLNEETKKMSDSSNCPSSSDVNFDTSTMDEMREMLEMVLVQSIRGSSEVGDFVLLIKLVHAAVDYATAFATNISSNNGDDGPSTALLPPRIFGEAISSLSKTKASLSKIKSLWSYFVHDVSPTAVLTSPPSAYELNAMLTALGERGKVSAAMKLYHQVTGAPSSAAAAPISTTAAIVEKDGETKGSGEGMGTIEGDAYTACILFGMLADSVTSNRGGGGGGATAWTVPNRNKQASKGGSAASAENEDNSNNNVSPCWQWNTATALLDTFAPEQLNNYAYAALLKVNERAMEEYADGASASARHDGARCAMSVLERMKSDRISPDVVTCSALMTTFDKGRNWKAAVTLLNAMQASDSSDGEEWSLPLPNTFTYSLAISACARSHQGDIALTLLNQMTEAAPSTSIASVDDGNHANSEVSGNAVWVYNAALQACAESASGAKSNAKGGVHLSTAFDILEKMENNEGKDNEGAGVNMSPDTVSYNTILSLLNDHSFNAVKEAQLEKKEQEENSTTRQLDKHDQVVDVVMDILDSMKERGVPRDAITYYNAILACKSSCENSMEIFRKSLEDSDFIASTSLMNKNGKNELMSGDVAQLKGRAATGVLFVVNAALSVAATSGNIEAVVETISVLSEMNDLKQNKLNAESIKHVIRTLGNLHDCESILLLLICLTGEKGAFANDFLMERYSLDILSYVSAESFPLVEEEVYATAITCCLKNDELGMADQILVAMKNHGLTPSQRLLKEIIAEYCRMAMTSSKEEFRLARLAKKKIKDSSGALSSPSQLYPIMEPIYITSRARAKAALTILKAVEKPLQSPHLLTSVAKACCAAGLWQDARSIVRRMHRAAIREVRLQQQQNANGNDRGKEGQFLNELPRLHRSLLKFCAKGGNITPALNFADDIQFLATQIRRQHGKKAMKAEMEEKKEPELLSSRLLMDISTPDSIPESDFSHAGALTALGKRPVGLTGQDWKLILIAASRGGHWKVCVGTLPFIRPYVKETHPRYARESLDSMSSRSNSLSHSYRPSLARLNKKYERIARALTAAILCFEARSQYAWAIRAIDDWIEWSGRRPRKEAVASACRVLAKRYRGQEVMALVTKVLSIPAMTAEDTFDPSDLDVQNDDSGKESDEYTYEKAIYTESINALHKNGLYEEADQLYEEGVSNGHLTWAVLQQEENHKDTASVKQKKQQELQLDLHGMSAAMAHSAVRVSLQKEIMRTQSSDDNKWDRDVIIITGRGRRSGEKFRPVLRPEVQRMLTEEFYPPLTTSSIPGNLGALLVPNADIDAWLSHQRQQKGERLMFVADVLRDISSGNRIERALRSSGNRIERALRNLKVSEDEEGASSTDGE